MQRDGKADDAEHATAVSPRPSIADERRPQILRAATRVIARRGFAGMRLSDVADEAGLSVGTLQHYFGSREAVLAAAFQHMQAASLGRWYASVDGETDPWRRIVSLMEGASVGSDRFRERWTLWMEYWAMCLRDAGMRRFSGDLHDAWSAPLLEAIEDGIATKRFRPRVAPRDIADRLISLMDGLALQLLLEVPMATRERMRDLLIDSAAGDLGVDLDGRLLAAEGQAASSDTASVSPSSGTRWTSAPGV
jgi:AcrR family transcriptional regulator